MTKLLRVSSLACFVFFAVFSTHADALVKFDFEQKFFAEQPGLHVKDHSLIRVNGIYHLYYLRGNPAINIGHATSTDLVHWKLEAPLLSVEPGEWDGMALWAPCVVKPPSSSTYFMYYTGVNDSWSQQTGIATAGDPDGWWHKLPFPVYHPDPYNWALWWPDAWSHGRDPFVFNHDGRYYLLNTAKTWADKGAISCAISTDMVNWKDIRPLYVHDDWHVLESVQCKQHNGQWHLFFTEEVVLGTSHLKSDSLFGGWDPSTTYVMDPGSAPEVNEFDEGHWMFSRHSIHNNYVEPELYVIRFDSLRWASNNNPYVHKPWPLVGDWSIVWGNAFLYQPTFRDNPVMRGGDDPGHEGLCWIGTYERYQGPLGSGSVGGYQGDTARGVIRSKTFKITGKSMNLLVGGGDYPDQCYVALVNAVTQKILFKETGKNTDVMDRRYWDLRPYRNMDVYIEISDNSTASFGHINCDDIQESLEIVGPPDDDDDNDDQIGYKKGSGNEVPGKHALYQNNPNPFNPTTTISYYLPEPGLVSLEIFDVNGKRVSQLVHKHEAEGRHEVHWHGANEGNIPMTTGVYFYRLTVDGNIVGTKKMMLLK